MPDEVLQSRVFECKLLEVSGKTPREHFSSKESEGLVQPTGTLAVRNAIEDILCTLSVDDIQRDGVSGVLLVFTKTPEVLIEEDAPSVLVFLKTGCFV